MFLRTPVMNISAKKRDYLLIMVGNKVLETNSFQGNYYEIVYPKC